MRKLFVDDALASPYEIKVSKTTLGDFIFGTFVKPIVSSRFKTLYEDAELKGITHFDPVKVYYQRQLLQVDFHHPEITLNSARVNILKSGLEFEGEQGCGRCQKAGRIIKRMNGLYFENENEIRDDIFNIKMIGAVVVSQNFKNFVERHTLSNISLVASKDYTAVSILGK